MGVELRILEPEEGHRIPELVVELHTLAVVAGPRIPAVGAGLRIPAVGDRILEEGSELLG